MNQQIKEIKQLSIPSVFSFTGRKNLKKMALFAYVHYTLSEAKEMDEQNKGQICVIEHEMVREKLIVISDRIEKMGYTYKACTELLQSMPQLKTYYNTVSGAVRKFFVAGDGWIPSLIALSALQEFSLKGHTEFEDIDFTSLIECFEKDDRADSSLHLKCAISIVEKLEKVKHKNKKKRK